MAQLPPDLTPEQQALAEQAFLDRASKNTPRALARLAPQVLAEIAPELLPSTEDKALRLEMQRQRATTKRSFSWGHDGDGSMWFRGSLPHLEAAPLITTIEAYVESDRRAARDRFTATRATQPNPQIIRDQATKDISRTPDQRRADALTQLIREHRAAPTNIGDRPRIVVTIREQDLRERAEKAGKLAKGAEITAGDLRRLCCDADLMPVVLGSQSEILDVGRTQRLVTPAIRKALTLRDGGCIFPNCTAPDSACEAHHIVLLRLTATRPSRRHSGRRLVGRWLRRPPQPGPALPPPPQTRRARPLQPAEGQMAHPHRPHQRQGRAHTAQQDQ